MTNRTDAISNISAAWRSLGDVAGALTPEQWIAQSLCPAWDMRGVVCHIATIDEALIGWAPGSEVPWSKMGEISKELAGLAPAELLARYNEMVARRIAELETMSDDDFATPGHTPIGPGTYGRFMEIRTFDIWVHERDVRVPLGIAGDDSGPTAERSLDEVHNSLGYIVGKKISLDDGQSIAFDVSGPVTRRMCVQVDGRAKVVPGVESPDATVSSDFLTFMLLACGRIDPQEPIDAGRITWTGDPVIGERAARNLRFTI